MLGLFQGRNRPKIFNLKKGCIMKKVLITGAGSGIGLACTKEFLMAGWRVYSHYHSSNENFLELKKGDFQKQLNFIQCDFTQKDQLKDFISYVDKYAFNALVNNAATYDFSKERPDRVEAVHNVFMVNVIAPTLITEVVYKKMKKYFLLRILT